MYKRQNRGELEKVLIHYENNQEKLEAARFLIRNMPRWYGYEGWQLDSIKPVLIQKDKGEAVPKEVIAKWQRVSFYSLPKVYDAKLITADYLIENIDRAFDVWKRYPWNRNQMCIRDRVNPDRDEIDVRNTPKCFTYICGTPQYVYCLYDGSSDFTAPSKIVIFQWNGKHIATCNAADVYKRQP